VIVDNDVARAAGRIEAVKATFREAHHNITANPCPDTTDSPLSIMVSMSQKV